MVASVIPAQEVAAEIAVGLHVANSRLSGGAPAELAQISHGPGASGL